MDGVPLRIPPAHPSKLGLTFAKACLVLECVVLDLLSGGWEEEPRRLAHQMSAALCQAARTAGWWERENALRALGSLLELSSSEIAPIRPSAGEKLLELLSLLKKASAFRSA